LGATPSDIRNQFLTEAVFVTAAGGIIGICLGLVASRMVVILLKWDFVMSPVAVALALAVSIGTGIFFGIYPALRAAKLDPVEALSFE
jgi:putative ABC transport system permease protein